MNTQVLLLILLLASKSTVSQQNNLTGKVVDSATNIPANGVSVMLMPGNETDITDASGRFFYKIIPKEVKTISIWQLVIKRKPFDFRF